MNTFTAKTPPSPALQSLTHITACALRPYTNEGLATPIGTSREVRSPNFILSTNEQRFERARRSAGGRVRNDSCGAFGSIVNHELVCGRSRLADRQVSGGRWSGRVGSCVLRRRRWVQQTNAQGPSYVLLLLSSCSAIYSALLPLRRKVDFICVFGCGTADPASIEFGGSRWKSDAGCSSVLCSPPVLSYDTRRVRTVFAYPHPTAKHPRPIHRFCTMTDSPKTRHMMAELRKVAPRLSESDFPVETALVDLRPRDSSGSSGSSRRRGKGSGSRNPNGPGPGPTGLDMASVKRQFAVDIGLPVGEVGQELR